ncbi:hypothetical protein [Nitrincola iocasae]|uniref:Uncharacterized protein n=1 Tax=Nitrincola iocasae TaxID=2614693 RepID=A0A5J6LF31_9GAMM|nr:hypothetical protein [Nitrincola iocasae]QEW07230.1 hypothetical protein F5I99_12340 [Nitrincola iocasae]
MLIRILPSLESREAWLNFFSREIPYCLVDDPTVLVDFQSTFLQLTQLNSGSSDPIRYTLGARSSLEPAWQLIKRCDWSLKVVLEGLNSLAFNSNVRDNSHFNLPADLSVRKSFAREPRLQPASRIMFPADSLSKEHFSVRQVAQLLHDEQYDAWLSLKSTAPLSPHAVILSLCTEPHRWQADQRDQMLTLYLDGQARIDCRLTSTSPPRRLSSQMVKL